MKRFAFLATIFTTVLVLVPPFAGGGSTGLDAPAVTDSGFATPRLASAASGAVAQVATASTSIDRINEQALQAALTAKADSLTVDFDQLAQKPVPKPLPAVTASGAASGTNERRAALESKGLSCPSNGGFSTTGAPSAVSAGGVAGTTTDDLDSFAATYNAIRIDNCLETVSYFVYDSCMEARLFWMAESPSPDPLDGWGHEGSVRSDGVPSVGCDGNLAGGSGNTGVTVASKWWESSGHRASLYRPGTGVGGVCIAFALTHGGIDEPYGFTRAAARWISC